MQVAYIGEFLCASEALELLSLFLLRVNMPLVIGEVLLGREDLRAVFAFLTKAGKSDDRCGYRSILFFPRQFECYLPCAVSACSLALSLLQNLSSHPSDLANGQGTSFSP